MSIRKPMSYVSFADLSEAAECLKVLAHPQRLQLVEKLLRGRFTVGELAEHCDIPSHVTSGHLRLMLRCGFLDSAKEGRAVYYRVSDPAITKVFECIRQKFAK